MDKYIFNLELFRTSRQNLNWELSGPHRRIQLTAVPLNAFCPGSFGSVVADKTEVRGPSFPGWGYLILLPAMVTG